MPSSTSSSKTAEAASGTGANTADAQRRFPWWIPAVASFLVAIWGPFVNLSGGPAHGPGQNQWASNHVAISGLLHSSNPPDVLILGSSISARLRPELLPQGWSNLGLRGASSQTGLALLDQLPQQPRLVLIEANLLEKPPDFDLLRMALGEPEATLRTVVPALRIDHQPANLVVTWLRRLRGPPAAPPDIAVDTENLRRQLALHTEAANQDALLAAQPALELTIAELQKRVTALEHTGTDWLFVWLPMDPVLESAPLMVARRNALLEAFGSDRLLVLNPEDRQTSDGLHLLPRAAAATTRALIESVSLRHAGVGSPTMDSPPPP